MSIRKFTMIIFLCLIVIEGIAWTLVYYSKGSTPAIFSAVALALSAGFTILSYAITSSGIETRIQAFVNYVIGAMMAKLFAAIISITIVAVLFTNYAVYFALAYLVSYFIFTAFEVFSLMRILRPVLKKPAGKSNEESRDK